MGGGQTGANSSVDIEWWHPFVSVLIILAKLVQIQQNTARIYVK